MPDFIQTEDGLSIAYESLPGYLPTVLFLPGFFSHMNGTKALWLEECCRKRGQSYVRFDYRGHGSSDGWFEEGTLSDWLGDALLVLDQVAKKPVVAVGSSMGGWIALLAALARPGTLQGVVGIATSPDFTKTILEERLSEEQLRELFLNGFIGVESEYQEEPVIITRRFIEDGSRHLLLEREQIDIDIPVCLIHGRKDTDADWQKAIALQQKIGKVNCKVILVPDGEHRLSRQQDLTLIDRVICSLSKASLK